LYSIIQINLDHMRYLDYTEQHDAGRVPGQKSRGAVAVFRMI